MNNLYAKKEELVSKIKGLYKEMAPLSEELDNVNKEINMQEFIANLPLTPQKVCQLDMDAFEKMPKQYSEYLKQFKSISYIGFNSETMMISFDIQIDQTKDLNDQILEVSQFFPHLPETIMIVNARARTKEQMTVSKMRITSSSTQYERFYLAFEKETGLYFLISSHHRTNHVLKDFESIEQAIGYIYTELPYVKQEHTSKTRNK